MASPGELRPGIVPRPSSFGTFAPLGSPGNRDRLYNLANRHLTEALPHVASGDYMGEHWLASFAVYALTMQ
jgi:hypothetical protein